ncbi:hypothetical protein FRC06_000511 [Ceratobasidium sp. 370]|nr:hypothetical protein FRC06_000511 [Ceratobasidium sp. 370]
MQLPTKSSAMQNQLVAIHRLPSEVLGSIFLNTVFPHSCFEKIGGWQRKWNALTVITSVCSQWRQVATGTCTLWEHVDLEEDDRQDEKCSLRFLDRAQLWLERGPEVEDNGHKYPSITLCNLRLLDIVSSDTFLAPLLSLLSTGPLPLDLRIRTGPRPETSNVIASFLERSKVASLAIEYGYKDDFSGETPPAEWTSKLSHMRMLIISCMWTNGPPVGKLVTSANGKPTARFPNLHTLLLFHCRRGGLTRRRIEQVVNAYSLHRIIFVESSDMYMRDEFPDDVGEDHDEDALGSDEADDYSSGLGDWLNKRVDTVTFEREYYWPGCDNEKWDPYVERLMASLDT